MVSLGNLVHRLSDIWDELQRTLDLIRQRHRRGIVAETKGLQGSLGRVLKGCLNLGGGPLEYCCLLSTLTITNMVTVERMGGWETE